MGPVVERVAKRLRDGASPGEKLVSWTDLTCDVALRHPRSPHGTPFVVVPFQPDFRQVTELVVLRDLANREMAMVVEDGLLLRETMKQTGRSLALQQEVIGDKGHSDRPILHAGSLDTWHKHAKRWSSPFVRPVCGGFRPNFSPLPTKVVMSID